MNEAIKCQCAMWATEDARVLLLGNGHHPNCQQYKPYVGAIEMIKNLTHGMTEWGHDCDGIHTLAWEAYKRGVFITSGKVLPDDRDYTPEFTEYEALIKRCAMAEAGAETAEEYLKKICNNSGAAAITEERIRQIEKEGWTPEHDDTTHANGEMAIAAAVYALPSEIRDSLDPTARPSSVFMHFWPWSPGDFKPCPGDRIRELVKAGALIAAEIDRQIRLNEKGGAV